MKNGDIELNPLKGVKHQTTIIFLHDYNVDNEVLWDLFSKTDKSTGRSFALKSSRIVLPLAPKIPIRAMAGRAIDTARSWFDILILTGFSAYGQ